MATTERSRDSVRTGGEWVVAALAAEGVRHVFGIPGVHNLAVYDALARDGAGIAHVLARHEQGAGFMADGYARSSGRAGVIVATTGPGATNVLTPLVESYAGSQPILAVVSDIPATLIGRDLGALHEVPNQIDCFRPMCRWAETVADASAFAPAVQRAFAMFRSARPGPVALSLPTDQLMARVPSRLNDPTGRAPACDRALVDRAAERLRDARRPVIVAGGGTVSAGAHVDLRALAERLGAPVITTVMGRGAVPETDPLWVGVLSNKYASQPLLEAADVVLAVGCRFAHRSTQGLLLNLSFSPDQTLIHLDIDPAVIGKLFPAQLAIVGDARDGLSALVSALGPGAPNPQWTGERLAELRAARSPRWRPETGRLIDVLRAAIPADGIVVNDQTGINYWMEWHFPVLAPRTFLYPVGSATLGYAVPAAIGAKIANPERAVVAVVGDGGFMFSVNELATAVKYRLGIAFLILNDARYGAIKYLQEAMFDGRWSETDLANPDFVALAHAFGAAGERLDGVDALGPSLERAFGRTGPTVIELPMGVLPPWEL
jgi:thiamine pyrophosphate-dependent acetolactate synthase large subunit-like protein